MDKRPGGRKVLSDISQQEKEEMLRKQAKREPDLKEVMRYPRVGDTSWTKDLKTGEWHHICITNNKVYVDGKLKATI